MIISSSGQKQWHYHSLVPIGVHKQSFYFHFFPAFFILSFKGSFNCNNSIELEVKTASQPQCASHVSESTVQEGHYGISWKD